MEKPDFIAHQMDGRRPWLDRLLGEGVRLMLVAVIALGGAYLALNHQYNVVQDSLRAHDRTDLARCRSSAAVVSNQRTVLLTLLGIIDAVDDRRSVGLRRLPPTLRAGVLEALSTLPDDLEC